MNEQFPGSFDDFEPHLDELTREYEEYAAFQSNKNSMFNLIEQLRVPADESSVSAKVLELHKLLDKHIDRFIQISQLILSRPDKQQAVTEWTKFLTIDDDDQQTRTFALTNQELLQPISPQDAQQIAWSYIKHMNLDMNDEYSLASRVDLDKEDWITDGYVGRELRRINGILDSAPDGVAEAFANADDEDDSTDEPGSERTSEYSYIDAYTSDLTTLADIVKTDLQSVDFGPTNRYLGAYYEALDNTDTLRAFEQKAKYIDRIVLTGNDDDAPKVSAQRCYILQEPSFIDGFRFAMIVNNRLLSPDSDRFDMSALNLLAEHTHDLMGGIAEIAANLKDDENIDDIIADYGLDLYDANLAHPEDPYAKQINQQYNPLNELAEIAATDLFNLVSNADNKNSEALQNTQDFYAGFGIGRTIYNAYRMDQIKHLEQLYDSTINS